jgi:hypothetical protein
MLSMETLEIAELRQDCEKQKILPQLGQRRGHYPQNLLLFWPLADTALPFCGA